MNFKNHTLKALVILSGDFKHIKDDIFVMNGQRYNLGLCFVDYKGGDQTQFDYFVFAKEDTLVQSVEVNKKKGAINTFEVKFGFLAPEEYVFEGGENAIAFPVLMRFDLEHYDLPSFDVESKSVETGTFRNQAKIYEEIGVEKIYFRDYVKRKEEKVNLDDIQFEETPEEEKSPGVVEETPDEVLGKKRLMAIQKLGDSAVTELETYGSAENLGAFFSFTINQGNGDESYLVKSVYNQETESHEYFIEGEENDYAGGIGDFENVLSWHDENIVRKPHVDPETDEGDEYYSIREGDYIAKLEELHMDESDIDVIAGEVGFMDEDEEWTIEDLRAALDDIDGELLSDKHIAYDAIKELKKELV